MLTQLRSLLDLQLVEAHAPRSVWLRPGWSEPSQLPAHPGLYRLRLRHVSGGMPPLDVCAHWDGQRFADIEADPYTAIPGVIQPMAQALFERPDMNRAQWDITGWISGEQ